MRLDELRQAVADVIAAAVPESVTYAHTADAIADPPAVLVDLATPFADYQARMGGTTARWRLMVWVLTGSVDSESAQQLLGEWASPEGPLITALFESNLPDAEVLTITGQQYGRVSFGNATYLGLSFLVEIET